MSTGESYSTQVRALFAAPRRAGDLADGPGERIAGEAAEIGRGAWVRFEARLRDGRIAESRFRAWGCPHVLAACEFVARRLEGRVPPDLDGLDAASVAMALEVPPEKLGRLLVIEDALRALAAAARAGQ